MNEEHEFNETKEIERLYHELSTPRSRSRLCFLLYLFIIPFFIIIGGVTFSFSELTASQEAERGNAQVCVAERKILMKSLKASLENNFSTNSNTLQNLTNLWQSIQNTVIEIESCHRKRLFELLPVETFVFRNAMLYSFGVYTTIGYGNLFPRTVQGRILTVVYAVVGIPLNVAFISDLGELVSRTVKRALHCFQRRILNKATEDPCIECKKFSLIVLIAFLFTPVIAVVVMEAERSRYWNYVDSLYYTFTTSTLIGLGDFTPQPSYVQFFVLMPLFFISETLFALAFGFLTVSVWLKFRFLLHRRLQHMKSTLQEENLRSSQELTRLSTGLIQQKNTEIDGTKASVSADAGINAEIAELSTREMLIDEKIDRDIQMLEAMPSQIDLGVLNAQMKSDDEEKRRLRHNVKKWLHNKEDKDMK
uniref:Ion channel n=1 Tax=Loa loa TaxID=7209 RepID=A0A1I7VQ69_LOALO